MAELGFNEGAAINQIAALLAPSVTNGIIDGLAQELGFFGTLGFMDVCLGVWSLTIRRDPAERLLRTWLLGTGRGDGGLTVSPQVGGGMLGWHGAF